MAVARGAQYAIIGPVLALASLLPLAGVPHARVAHIYAGIFGASLVIAGIADHIRFRQLLPGAEAAA